jgi:hypothetical protein
MKRTHFLLGAVVAGCLSATAWAADTNAGDKGAMQDAQQGTQPSAQNMDANAQRAHSRSRGTEPGNADAAKSKGMQGSSTVASGETRDWSQVDTNHDNLVSPDEMQAYLDQHHPSGAKSGDSGSAKSGDSASAKTATGEPAAKK